MGAWPGACVNTPLYGMCDGVVQLDSLALLPVVLVC